jgi:hypothetical protein
MRKKLLYPLGLSLGLLALVHYSCQKEINPGFPDPSQPPVENVKAGISGRVTDENKLPVQGAIVKAGAVSTTTDVNGNFNFTGVLLDKNAAFVKVEKAGYFLGSRTFITKPDATHYVEIELIPKTISGSFDAASGGSVTIANGGSVQFSANSIINPATNSAYSGSVSVSAYFINPEAPNFGEIMPGDLRGLTTANEERGLQSLGMMVVELTGAGGEKLNVAAGKNATLSFPVPSSLLAKAPPSIPLWYFDETKGLWKEEGSATKQGSNYVGTVSHFSFWNCDAPFPLVDFKVLFKDQASQPLAGGKVEIRIAGDSAITSGWGYTDSEGRAGGKIPANKNLELLVYNKCNTLLYSKNIGPYTGSTDLGTVRVASPAPSSVSFTGAVVNCANAPVSNGFVNILINGMNYRVSISNGTYATTIGVCTNGSYTATLTAFDQTGNQYGNATDVTVTGGSTANKDLTACGNTASQYINYTIGGSSYVFSVPADSIFYSRGNGYTNFNAMSQSPYRYLYLNLSTIDTIPGTYPLSYLSIYHDSSTLNVINQGTLNATITQYGSVNGYITGNFSGTVKDSIGTGTYPINCSFKIKRTR